MKKVYIFFVLLCLIDIFPLLPMPIKGIIGLGFIIIGSVKFGYRIGIYAVLITTIINILLIVIRPDLNSKYDLLTIILGGIVCCAIAFYLGKASEALKNKNKEVINEIEKRKKVEKELKKNKALLESLMDALPIPMYVKDLELRFLKCNRAYEENISIKEEYLIGKKASEVFNAGHAELHEKKDKELIIGKRDITYESTAIYSDGTERNIIWLKSLIESDENRPFGILSIMIDKAGSLEHENLKKSIIEEKHILDEMLKYDKMKIEFFSNISHEFRTPLNVILGAIQLLEIYSSDDKLDKKKIRRNLESMKQNCYRLLRLVNNLIDITKIDSNAFEANLKNWDIVYLVREITSSVSDFIADKGIDFSFYSDQEEIVIACDDEYIERILLNLLSNSIKFTPEGGSISVCIYDRQDHVLIQVEDSGRGIPSDKKDYVFERFYQIDPTFTRLNEGSGIGLSLVKALVELHGGTINFESELGKGTTFNIELPCRQVNDEQEQIEYFKRYNRVERMQLEFSDIYSIERS